MKLVLLTALGVGGATICGAILGFVFKHISHKFSDMVLGFAAGVMLAAAIIGLILPSLESGVLIAFSGIFAGALCLNAADKLIPHLHHLSGADGEFHPESTERINKIMLFVLAVAIHNFPEGIAAGVGFGGEDPSRALTIAGGIALQNIPEGMVIIGPMLAAGINKKRTFIAAAATGIIEVAGTIIGYLAAGISAAVLPFALAFAGGTMLYVISDEMIPETHAHGNEQGATYALLIGFCLMLLIDIYL